MTPEQYQPLAMRTAPRMGLRKDVMHAALGLVTEVGELCDHLKRVLAYGIEFDKTAVHEEVADVCWYAALLCHVTDQQLKDYFPTQQLVPDSVERLALDAAFYAGAVASNVTFRAEHELNFTFDGDLKKLISALSKICAVIDMPLEQALDRNIAKLAKRYPEGFSEWHALNRDLNAEREVLEHGAQ